MAELIRSARAGDVVVSTLGTKRTGRFQVIGGLPAGRPTRAEATPAGPSATRAEMAAPATSAGLRHAPRRRGLFLAAGFHAAVMAHSFPTGRSASHFSCA